MTLPLTAKQHQLLRFIESRELSPSVEEMRLACGCKSRSQVARMLDSLEVRGFIRRTPGRSRTVEAIPRDGDGGGETALKKIASSALLAELERRGILLTGIVRHRREELALLREIEFEAMAGSGAA